MSNRFYIQISVSRTHQTGSTYSVILNTSGIQPYSFILNNRLCPQVFCIYTAEPETIHTILVSIHAEIPSSQFICHHLARFILQDSKTFPQKFTLIFLRNFHFLTFSFDFFVNRSRFSGFKGFPHYQVLHKHLCIVEDSMKLCSE